MPRGRGLAIGVGLFLVAVASIPAPAQGAVRAAFYETSYPEAWSRGAPYTPTLGQYDQSDAGVIATHLELMESSKLDAALARWNGPGTASDSRFAALVEQSVHSSVKVAAWFRPEESSNPTSGQIAYHLRHIAAYAASGSYLRIGGRPAVFVHSGEAESWRRARPLERRQHHRFTSRVPNVSRPCAVRRPACRLVRILATGARSPETGLLLHDQPGLLGARSERSCVGGPLSC